MTATATLRSALGVVERAITRWTAARGARMMSGADWRAGDTRLLINALAEELEAEPLLKMLALLREIAQPRDYYLPDAAHEWSENARAIVAEIDAEPPSVGRAR